MIYLTPAEVAAIRDILDNVAPDSWGSFGYPELFKYAADHGVEDRLGFALSCFKLGIGVDPNA